MPGEIRNYHTPPEFFITPQEQDDDIIEDKNADSEIWAEFTWKGKEIRIHKSVALARIIGLICGGISLDTRALKMTSTDKKFLEYIREEFSSVLEIDCSEIKKHEYANSNQNPTHKFAINSSQLIMTLGNLQGDFWSKTLENQYQWILENPEYALSFLSGYYDSRGSTGYIENTPYIHIPLKNSKDIQIIQFILSQSGIGEGIVIPRSDTRKDIYIKAKGQIFEFIKVINTVPDLYKKPHLQLFAQELDLTRTISVEDLCMYEITIWLKHENPNIRQVKIIDYLSQLNLSLRKSRLNNWLNTSSNPYGKKSNHISLIAIVMKLDSYLRPPIFEDTSYNSLIKMLIQQNQEVFQPGSIGISLFECVYSQISKFTYLKNSGPILEECLAMSPEDSYSGFEGVVRYVFALGKFEKAFRESLRQTSRQPIDRETIEKASIKLKIFLAAASIQDIFHNLVSLEKEADAFVQYLEDIQQRNESLRDSVARSGRTFWDNNS